MLGQIARLDTLAGDLLAMTQRVPPRPEVAGSLFEPFVTGRADGTGLGLAIARELADAQLAMVRRAWPTPPAIGRRPPGGSA